MKIKFCGAARQVTGSSHLITLDDGYQILLDCGLYQGGSESWEENNKWYFDPRSVDCVVLSHAHIDHCGRLPQLVKSGFKGNIYATHATKNLCGIMLLDSAKIQERDVEWHNKKVKKKKKKARKQKFRTALYSVKHVTPTMQQFVGFGYNRWHYIREGVEVLFRDAGHILGSASVTLRITQNGKTRMIGFTGDIGRPQRPILRDPVQMPDVEYLITESTYGNRLHEMLPEQSEKLYNCIKHTCIDKKGKLIIPAFSLGRTQEIVYMLDKMETSGKLPKIPIYVDSPLAVNATKIFGLHPECFDKNLTEYLLTDPNPFGFNALRYVHSVEFSKSLNTSKEPCVIISASGMMNAGRIRHHLYNNMEDEKNTILIVGYCSPHTPGGLIRAGAKELKIFGEVKAINAEVQIMDAFSAHADRNEMYKFIKHQRKNVKNLFLVHGEHETQKEYKDYLLQKGFKKVEIPKVGQEIVLK